MKRLSLNIISLFLIANFISCKKNAGDCNLVAAKIIRYDCNRVIFQLLTPESIGDADWQDTQTGTLYSNVVSYYNTCAVASLTSGRLDTLYVGIRKSNERLWDSDCNQCLAISNNPPQTKVDFKKIAKSPCENR